MANVSVLYKIYKIKSKPLSKIVINFIVCIGICVSYCCRNIQREKKKDNWRLLCISFYRWLPYVFLLFYNNIYIYILDIIRGSNQLIKKMK